MGKPKGPGSVPNKPIYSRISYLYQAAAYLSTAGEGNDPTDSGSVSAEAPTRNQQSNQILARRFLGDMRATSLKTQIRLSPTVKHTVCKFCDSLLIPGQTSTTSIENSSKGGKKPWADVLVVKCDTCGGVKRMPVHAGRQKRRTVRETQAAAEQKSRSSKDKSTVAGSASTSADTTEDGSASRMEVTG